MPRAFLASRTPPAPVALAGWLGGVPVGPGDVGPALLEAGLRELDAARTGLGRVRRSAFHLLAADALVTYACEAALGAHDPRESLVEILRRTATAGR